MTPMLRTPGPGVDTLLTGAAGTPYGPVLLACLPDGTLCFAHLHDDDPGGELALLARLYPGVHLLPSRLPEQAWQGALANPDNATLAPRGTTFQLQVWNVLRGIPAGHTISYAHLARLAQRPTATRAVARACHDNRLHILIPCHRVVASHGRLGGYAAGQHRKRQLLDDESDTLFTACPGA